MINIQNLNFSYTKKQPYLINDLNLHIEKGMYVSIVGENGSCKTTLVKLILGLLKPISGSINIASNSIGYVPQRLESFNSQFPITVLEVLQCHKKLLKNNDIVNIDDILEEVNLLSFKNNLLGALSGGQQQRVLIARALMGNPDLIILDEPSTGVDHANQLEIYTLLSKINRNNKTIISIEHNIDIAMKYSTHILKVTSGTFELYTKNEYKNVVKSSNFLNDAI